MGISSADPNKLDAFVDTGSQQRRALESAQRAAKSTQSSVVAGSSFGHPQTRALDALGSALSNMGLNERFVGKVRDALVRADNYTGSGIASVDDATIESELRSAGLLGRPAVITVEPLAFIGLTRTSGMVDDPVCAFNGNFVHGDEDLRFNGFAAELGVVRVYNSLAAHIGGMFGPGWSSGIDVEIDIAEQDRPRVRLADGATVPFQVGTDGVYRSVERPLLTLENSDSGWRLRQGATREWSFDAHGTWLGSVTEVATVFVRRSTDQIEVAEQRSGRSVIYELVDRRVRRVVSSHGEACVYDYDDNGRLVSVAREIGDVRYDVDEAGLIAAIVDADGVVLCRNRYDDLGRVLKQVSIHGRVTQYDYDDLVTVVTDEDGGPRNVLIHDHRGNLVAMFDGEGAVMRMSYDEQDQMTTLIDRTGAMTRYAYDSDGRLVERRDPDDLTHSWFFDDRGRLSREVDRAGLVTAYTYAGETMSPSIIETALGSIESTLDDRGLPIVIRDADGVETEYEWDIDGQLAAIQDASGSRISFHFDDAGRLSALRDRQGELTELKVDSAGRVIEIRGPRGRERYRYSAAGRCVAMELPDDVSCTVSYDSSGEVSKLTDALGSAVTFARDALGNLTKVVAPDGAVYQLEHDRAGRIVSTVDPAGARTSQTYDAEGRSTAVTGADGRAWHRVLDALGRTLAVVGPDETTETRSYHPNGEIASITTAAGAVYRSEVDAGGRITAVVDPAGERTEYKYSPAGRLLRITSPLGRVETRTYDQAGRLSTVDGADGSKSEIVRRSGGLPESITTEERAFQFGYDSADRLVTVRGDTSLDLSWTEGGRLASQRVPGASPRQLYWDARGLLTTVVDPAGIVSEIGRDARGRAIEAVTANHRWATAFDESGWLARLEDPVGQTVTFGHDAAGRLTDTRTPGGGATYEYDDSGRLQSVSTANHIPLLALERDPDGQVTRATTAAGEWHLRRDFAGRLLSVARGEEETSYDWDADGLLVARHDSDGATTRYVRDEGGRLTGYEHPAVGQVALPPVRMQVERDIGGRIVADEEGRIFRYDDSGRLVESTSTSGMATSYEYGPLGLLESEQGDEGSRSYYWDPAGRLERSTATNGLVTTYSYDAAGRRVSASCEDGTSVAYEWNDLNQLVSLTREASDGVKSSTTLEFDAFGRAVQIGAVDVGWDDVDTQKAVRVGSRAYLRHGGIVMEATTDSSWSRGLFDDPWGDDGGSGVRIGFRGELAVDGLVLMGARVYEPATRSFLSPDPLAPVPGSLGFAGPYGYAWNDPVNYLDPSGLRPLSDAEYEQIRLRQEQGTFEKAWNAIQDDPWGTLAMAGVVAVGVGLLFVPGGQVIGAGILIGAAVSGGVGLATGNFNPRAVALGGVIGAAVPAAGISIGGAIAFGAGVGAVGNTADQVFIQGRGLDNLDWGQIAVGTGLGAVAGGASAALTRAIPRSVDLPGPTGVPPGRSVDTLDNLISDARTVHILDGDVSGGGHLWPGLPGKTPFPRDWSGDRIMHAISDIASDPSAWNNSVTQGGRTVLTGTRGGVQIRVIVDSQTGQIVTGYPTNLPRNP